MSRFNSIVESVLLLEVQLSRANINRFIRKYYPLVNGELQQYNNYGLSTQEEAEDYINWFNSLQQRLDNKDIFGYSSLEELKAALTKAQKKKEDKKNNVYPLYSQEAKRFLKEYTPQFVDEQVQRLLSQAPQTEDELADFYDRNDLMIKGVVGEAIGNTVLSQKPPLTPRHMLMLINRFKDHIKTNPVDLFNAYINLIGPVKTKDKFGLSSDDPLFSGSYQYPLDIGHYDFRTLFRILIVCSHYIGPANSKKDFWVDFFTKPL